MRKIVIRQLSKAFDTVPVLDAFSLEIAPADRVVILGPSGSGKTTLLRLIAGLDMPDGGEILIDGQSASRPDWVLPPYQRDLSMVFQTPALWPHMTVAENIRFGLSRLDRDSAEQRTAELLAALGLKELAARYPHQLSGGEARRVALARALAPRPALLLMDEPLTNLNPDLKQQVLALIQSHLEQHHPTLVYVTHDAEEARAISPHVVTLPGRQAL